MKNRPLSPPDSPLLTPAKSGVNNQTKLAALGAQVKRLAEQVEQVQQPAQIDTPALLSAKDMAHRLRVSVRTVWRLVAVGIVPEPIRYTRKLVRWLPEAVAQTIERMANVQQ